MFYLSCTRYKIDRSPAPARVGYQLPPGRARLMHVRGKWPAVWAAMPREKQPVISIFPNFFYFYFFIKNICGYIFFQKCHPAAGWFGGKELPPDEPVVRSLAHSPWKLPLDQAAVALTAKPTGGKCYRRAVARL